MNGVSSYSVSDLDNNLNVTDTSITISGSDINKRGRIYKNIKLSDYTNDRIKLVYKFDFNMSKCDKGQGGVTWGNQSDVTRDSGMKFAGLFFGTNPRVTLGNSNGDGVEISNFNLNQKYTVELTWDLTNKLLQAKLIDNNNNLQGSGSITMPSINYDYFYAFQQRNGGASYPGVLSGVFSNFRWSFS